MIFGFPPISPPLFSPFTSLSSLFLLFPLSLFTNFLTLYFCSFTSTLSSFFSYSLLFSQSYLSFIFLIFLLILLPPSSDLDPIPLRYSTLFSLSLFPLIPPFHSISYSLLSFVNPISQARRRDPDLSGAEVNPGHSRSDLGSRRMHDPRAWRKWRVRSCSECMTPTFSSHAQYSLTDSPFPSMRRPTVTAKLT